MARVGLAPPGCPKLDYGLSLDLDEYYDQLHFQFLARLSSSAWEQHCWVYCVNVLRVWPARRAELGSQTSEVWKKPHTNEKAEQQIAEGARDASRVRLPMVIKLLPERSRSLAPPQNPEITILTRSQSL